MTFEQEFDRRIRAVLAARTGRDVPADAKVEIELDSVGFTDDSRGVDNWLRISCGAVKFEYEEPGAFARLMFDLDAMPLDGT